MTIEMFCFVGIAVLVLSGFLYVSYQLGDNGRWVRDFGVQSSHISDNQVKSIWCDRWAEDNGFDADTLRVNVFYSENNGKQYCGDIEVKMDCSFTNKGDYCSIIKQN